MTPSAKPNNAVPKYARIYESLCSKIRAGQLKVGDQVEAERQLAKRFGVSLMTVRQALQMLEHDGYVERRHGSGTFVRMPNITWNRLIGFTEQMAARGMKAGTRLLGTSLIKADEEMAEQLQIPQGGLLARIERLRMADSKPVALETVVLSFGRMPGVLNYKWDHCSLFQVLEDQYQITVSHADEDIEACLASKQIADLLQVPTGSPLLYVHQILFASGSRPLSILWGYYPADRHRFKVIRKRVGSSGADLWPT